MTQLHNYLARIQNTILSRQEVEIEILEILDRSDKVGQSSELYTVLRFYDGSQLHIVEKLIVEHYTILKVRYAYHYQKHDDILVFRYDNVPHHPEIETFPDHKHVGDLIVASQPPDTSKVLKEIDVILYSEKDTNQSNQYLDCIVNYAIQHHVMFGPLCA